MLSLKKYNKICIKVKINKNTSSYVYNFTLLDNQIIIFSTDTYVVFCKNKVSKL